MLAVILVSDLFTFFLSDLNQKFDIIIPLLGDSGGVVNSLDFCSASLKSLGCF